MQLFSLLAVVPVQDTVRHPAEPGSAVARCRAGTAHNTLLTIILRTEIVLQQTNLLKLITPFSIQLNKTLNQRWAHGDDRMRVELLPKHDINK